MWSDTAMARRNPPKRTATASIQVRISKALETSLEDVLKNLKDRKVLNSRGLEMTKTDLMSYWLKWLSDQDDGEQAEWVRAYRAAHFRLVENEGRPPDVAPDDSAADTSPAPPTNATVDLRNRAAKKDKAAAEVKATPPRSGRK